MSTVPLPGYAHPEHLRNQAKAFQRSVRSGDAGALDWVRTHHPDAAELLTAPERFPRHAAQLVVARTYDFATWPRLMQHLKVIAAHRWDAEALPEPEAEWRPDRFCRLACLTYGHDELDRREQARELMATSEVSQHIWAAAAANDAGAVAAYLAADPAWATARGGPYGWTALYYLTYSRIDPDVGADVVLGAARLLLDAGADPDEGYFWNGMPPPFTVLTGVFGEGEGGPIRQPRHPHSLALGRLLLERGADPNDGQTLYNRMFLTDDDHLRLLFEFGLGTGDGGPWKKRLGDVMATPAQMVHEQLAWAVAHAQDERVRLLLEHGADPNGESEPGRSLLMTAKRNGDRQTADTLLAFGARPVTLHPREALIGRLLTASADDRDQISASPLLDEVLRTRPGLVVWAAAQGKPDAVRLLVELGWDVNALGRSDLPQEEPRQTALHGAAYDDDLEMAILLVSLGADTGIREARHEGRPLDWARFAGSERTAAYLEPLT